MSKIILNVDKYKQVIHYLISKMGEIQGKKKMYKLLYFIDFDYYEAYDTSLTGETYKKLKMGPAPIYFDQLICDMKEEIQIVQRKLAPHHENDTWFFTSKTTPKCDLNIQEIKMIDRVIRKYGELNGKELEKISHGEAPWNAVEMYQIIPYEYSIYRDSSDLTD